MPKLNYERILREYMCEVMASNLKSHEEAIVYANLNPEEIAFLIWLESDIKGENAEAGR